jgi:hypothetical protein
MPLGAAPAAAPPLIQAFLDGGFVREEQTGSFAYALVTPTVNSALSSASVASPFSTASAKLFTVGKGPRDGLVCHSLPSCQSSTVAELAAFAAVLLDLPAFSSLEAVSDSSGARNIVSSLPSLSHRKVVRSIHRPLIRLLRLLVLRKKSLGCRVIPIAVRAHQEGTERSLAGNILADHLATTGRDKPQGTVARLLGQFDFPFRVHINGNVPVGDPAKVITKHVKQRNLQAGSESTSQSVFFSPQVSDFILTAQTTHPTALSFATALFSNTLPLRQPCYLRQHRSAEDLALIEALDERVEKAILCPLCCNGPDDVQHLLYCPATQVHLRSISADIATRPVPFISHMLEMIPPHDTHGIMGAHLFGAFSPIALRLASRWHVLGDVHRMVNPAELALDLFKLWHSMFRHRKSQLLHLPYTFSPFSGPP